MKYAKELPLTIARLPSTLQEGSLDYKLWKKRCKQVSIEEALVLLNTECQQVNAIFVHEYQECCRRPPSLFHQCFRKFTSTTIAPASVLLFAHINATTVYKICKRLQKMSPPSPIPMMWLASMRASHMYEFLGGHHTAHLEMLRNQSTPYECPICINPTNPQNVLIYACGHHACISCTLQYAYAHQNGPIYNGKWYHVLPYAKRRTCPYCRFADAFHGATTATI